MGNCLKHEATPMQWGGEDWDFLAKPKTPFSSNKAMKIEEKTILENKDDFQSYSATKTRVKEVKIKITKKQLEELLGRVDVQGLSVQQVLAQLMNVSDRFEKHQRSWRPALQSIPEVN